MPTQEQFKSAIDWSLTQTFIDKDGSTQQITKSTISILIDSIRIYFNENNISYTTFSYNDVLQYLI